MKNKYVTFIEFHLLAYCYILLANEISAWIIARLRNVYCNCCIELSAFTMFHLVFMHKKKLFYKTYPRQNELPTYWVKGDSIRYEKMAYLWQVSSILSNALFEKGTDSFSYIYLLEISILPTVEYYYDTPRIPHAFQSNLVLFAPATRYYNDNL